MPADGVVGAEKLAALSRALRTVGADERKGLRRELYRGINRATKPLKKAAQDSARANLPSSGGLAARVAKSKFTTKTTGGGANVGVRIVASGGLNLSALDKGRLRHPVFGNRAVWVQQSVQPEWFSGPIRAGAPVVRRELEQSLEVVAEKIVRAIG